ncbi:aminotransferase class V-fold PLP-dependent enzyme [Phyllobacterium sp. YR531]|uniref:aminotransferase class V-fold PLP-dependent enzyme n=1 Tax=Phyllobacterium sp. YR531 TaxID=1144343 RepID=UPI00026FB1EB|nr:aminotransferase class V-fold PLP-dependent enzyme [Phyllobacterium sp. YR531]EJN05820.1 selenocysteine lyase [Phyllobacterium sp. YR531]
MKYFLYHSIGTYPGKEGDLKEVLAQFAHIWSAADDGQWGDALQTRRRFLDRWAQLIEAPNETLTLTENVTLALYSFIGGLPRARLSGKTILVAQDCFPSLHFLLSGLSERFRFTLKTVPTRSGEYFVQDDDFLSAWDGSVGLALVTWVSSTTSKRCDLEAMAQRARDTGSLLIVDVTQGIGIIPFKVEDGISAVVGSTLKWLCGTAGAGVLHVSADLLQECRPELRGWFSQENPFSWNLDAFTYAPDARRFDHGTPSVLSAYASLPGIEFVLQQGVDKLSKHNQLLTATIIEFASSNSLEVSTPKNEKERGGSIMLNARSEDAAAHLVHRLKCEDFYVDHRGGTIRLSPGIVTTQADTESLCRVLYAARELF